MNPKSLHQITQLLAAAFVLAILLWPFAHSQANERTLTAENQRHWAHAQDPAGSTHVIPPEKREKLHRLDPEDLFKNGKDRNVERASSSHIETSRLKRRERNKRNRRDRETREAETAAAAAALPPLSLETAAPATSGSGLAIATTPLEPHANPAATPDPSPTLLAQTTIPANAAAALEQRAEQPSWLLPLVGALFLVVLGALVMVLGKLNKILRGSGV